MDNEMDSSLTQYRSPTSFNTNYQTISDKQQIQQSQISPEQLKEKLRKQLEYYFSKENIINDIYLQSQMDADNYVPIAMIANFKLIKRLTHDLQLITNVLKESPLVEVDTEEKKVRSSDKIYLPTRKRCIIILRNVPLNATENEILEIFINESCPVSAIGCERVLESDHSDCWYVTFNSEDDAQNAFLYLTRENISIHGQKILARMKACLWQKPVVSPSDNIIKPSIPTKSSPISTQERYAPVYLQSIPTSHTNQSSFLRNIPQQHTTIHYHPTQILQHQQQQQQQHLPMSYNILQHPHPFATNPQPINMNFYPQTQFVNRNHHVFPTNFWYIPPTMDSYSPMAYNGNHKHKHRVIPPKPRINNNATKPVSNNEGSSIINNPLDNSCQSNTTSPVEENHSSLSQNEIIVNHSNDLNTSSIDDHQNSDTLQSLQTEKQITITSDSNNQ
ncbi:unnamed protein product [Adineta steineri]|uniref:HTH La-type RNA-binding domain-containing protein n=1 Tax=Adineta steineri TaxID=433720 RepID=A0A819DNQ8_9BILA|nr:unnamed protein product [Adineta steineri]